MWLHFMCVWHFFIRIICLLSYSSFILFGLCVAIVFVVQRAIAAIQYIYFAFIPIKHLHMHINIHVYGEREREREKGQKKEQKKWQ